MYEAKEALLDWEREMSFTVVNSAYKLFLAQLIFTLLVTVILSEVKELRSCILDHDPVLGIGIAAGLAACAVTMIFVLVLRKCAKNRFMGRLLFLIFILGGAAVTGFISVVSRPEFILTSLVLMIAVVTLQIVYAKIAANAYSTKVAGLLVILFCASLFSVLMGIVFVHDQGEAVLSSQALCCLVQLITGIFLVGEANMMIFHKWWNLSLSDLPLCPIFFLVDLLGLPFYTIRYLDKLRYRCRF